jgi:hypothetical protein
VEPIPLGHQAASASALGAKFSFAFVILLR